MRILLLNDNPVVRKLVALSAQKTKDDLDVIWSLDEIEHPHYDLLIMDDALYSDEAMRQLRAKITFKSTLLMATRGSAVPAGFDKVINKPFLPTDLVELFVGIANTLPDVDLDDVIGSSVGIDDSLLDDDFLINDSEEFSLDDLIEDEDNKPRTNILDSQEVQEVQSLLDDAEGNEDVGGFDDLDFEVSDIGSIEDLEIKPQGSFASGIDIEDLDELKESTTGSIGIEDLDELDEFNEQDLDELKEISKDELSDDELEAMLLSGNVKSESSEEDDINLEALLADMSAEELSNEPLSDDDFETLEQQIQEAMGNLEPEDLEQSLEAVGLDDLDFDDLEEDLDILSVADKELLLDEDEVQEALEDVSLDAIDDDEVDVLNTDTLSSQAEEALVLEDNELLDQSEEQSALGNGEVVPLDDDLVAVDMGDLDGLDEREIRIAIGEEVEEEEVEIRAGSGEHASLDVEALSEAMGKLPALALDELDLMELEESQESSPAAGMEALQSLLKALSNEEVAKSLKGLNISININFGNDK
jgi:uncharacterized membrane protein